MIALTETTIAMTLAVLGVLGTLVRYALAWRGISTLNEMQVAVTHRSPNNK